MDYKKIIEKLKSLSDPEAVEGMARYGITPEKTYGVSIPNLRKIAKETGRDQDLSLRLWECNTRETRILAGMIGDPVKVTLEQIESWVREFTYWEICDQCCMNLFEKTVFAYRQAEQWSMNEEEFIKRAGFVLMARLAVSDKKADDNHFENFLPLIKREAADGRNFVKKSVNWALRQIGKRNLNLNKKAILTAKEIQQLDSKPARWIASDALRELTSDAVQNRLKY
jgi:3-methyladenine DNA glycosylase AlkD